MNKATKLLLALNEAKGDKTYLLLLTNRREEKDNHLYFTVKRFVEEAKRLHIPTCVVFVEDSFVLKQDSGLYLISSSDKAVKPFEFDPKDTVAVVRGSIGRSIARKDLVSQLEKAGVFCVNNREALEVCGDKYRTALRLADMGIPTPRTVLIQEVESISHVLERLSSDFPFVVKTLSGSKGIGAIIVESERALRSFLQLIWKVDETTELLIQEFIESPYDIRVHVLDNEVIAAMKRYVIGHDFRSNYSQGGKVAKIKLTSEQEEAAIRSSKAVGTTWAGVDIIPSKSGENFVIEVNSSPGTQGIEEATGSNVIRLIIEHLLTRKHWYLVPQEVGYLEIVQILGQDLVAKFDTGNGNAPVVHSSSFTVDGGKVKWVLNGKEYTHKLITLDSVRLGGLRDYKEQRPVIELDVTFCGTTYQKIPFTLDDREGRTPVLLDRKFLRKMNVVVNPAKRYRVTTKPD